MRIINFAICIILCNTLVGQKYQLNSIQAESNELNATFNTYKQYNFDIQNLRSELIENIGSTIELSSKDFDIELELAPVDLLTADFQIKALYDDGPKYIDYNEVNTYVAYDKNNPNKQYRFYISDTRIQGMFTFEGEDYRIESARKYRKSADNSEIVVYKPTDRIEDKSDGNYTCHLDESDAKDETKGDHSSSQKITGGCSEVELAIAADYLLFEEQGGIDGVLEELVSILNDVQGDYSVQFDDVVQFRINELMVSCCEDCDPWISTTNLFTLLGWFKDWGLNDGFEKPHDLGLLWTNRITDGGVVGAAYLNSLCGTNRYSGLRHFTNDPGKLRMMTSHELGHTFGLPHNYSTNSDCHPNPGRDPLIMDPVVNSAAVAWSTGTENCVDSDPGDSSVERVNEKLLNSDCFDTECDAVGCISVSSLDVAEIWADYAEVNWDGNAESYTLKVRQDMEDNFLLEVVVDSEYYILDGATLNGEEMYIISIEANCGVEESGLKEVAFVTPAAEAALPVELLSFDAERDEDKVNLFWETASEINSDHFTLSRSADGLEYEVIAEIRTTGSPNSVSNLYSYVDDQPRDGLNYYRLEQFDYNGMSEKFEHIVVDVKLFEDQELVRLTEKGGDYLGVQIATEGNNNIEINVVDLSGKIVQHIAVDPANQRVNIDTSDMSTGIYVLQASSQTKRESFKFFVF